MPTRFFSWLELVERKNGTVVQILKMSVSVKASGSGGVLESANQLWKNRNFEYSGGAEYFADATLPYTPGTSTPQLQNFGMRLGIGKQVQILGLLLGLFFMFGLNTALFLNCLLPHDPV